MRQDDNLQVPLPLAEMLHALLGPLGEQLTREGHSWAPFVSRVVDAYTQGRDDHLSDTHGPAVLRDIDVCTLQVADKLCGWVAEMASEEEDFDLWAREFLNGNEAAS